MCVCIRYICACYVAACAHPDLSCTMTQISIRQEGPIEGSRHFSSSTANAHIMSTTHSHKSRKYTREIINNETTRLKSRTLRQVHERAIERQNLALAALPAAVAAHPPHQPIQLGDRAPESRLQFGRARPPLRVGLLSVHACLERGGGEEERFPAVGDLAGELRVARRGPRLGARLDRLTGG